MGRFVAIIAVLVVLGALAGAVFFSGNSSGGPAPKSNQDPPPSSAKQPDWSLARVSPGSVRYKSIDIDYGVALDVRQFLQTESTAAAPEVRCKCKRVDDEAYVTELWCPDAKYPEAKQAILIDWRARSVKPLEHHDSDKLKFRERSENDIGSLSVSFAHTAKGTGKCIAIEITPKNEPRKTIEIPYDYGNYETLPAYGSANYPIAAAPKRDKTSGKIVSILLLDIQSGALIAELAQPSSAVNSTPNFAIDEKENIFLACGSDIGWLMAVDLKPYLRAKNATGAIGTDGKK